MKRKKNHNGCFLVVAVLVFALAASSHWGLLSRLFYTHGQEAPETLSGIPVYTDYLTEGTLGRPGTKRQIAYITIHETDNFAATATAQAHNSYLHEIAQTKSLSWHYTVDDHEIWHHVPDDEIAFNAGDGHRADGGNMEGIGIEMCVNKGGDYEETLRNTAVLTAYLLNTYHLSLEQVKKHEDFSGKQCPARLIASGRWTEFLQMVQEKL